MRRIDLFEHRPTLAVPLSSRERDQLRLVAPWYVVQPTLGRDGEYDITPDSHVGTINLGTVGFEVRPKIPLNRVLFLAAYSLDPGAWRAEPFQYESAETVVESVIPPFVAHVRRALRPGVLQGYRREEDALLTVRGRVRFPDQVRRRFGRVPPVEVAFDEFTEDIDENRLLKAALNRLRRLGPRSSAARALLRGFDAALERVTLAEFDARRIPDPQLTRLSERYRPAIALARLILASTMFELGEGTVHASAFLLDMNSVFEDFVVVALREALALSPAVLRQGDRRSEVWLDEAHRIQLRPDLSWWETGRCRFVADVKYKRIAGTKRIRHPDLYQVLAYAIATDLDDALLIYAAGEGERVTHHVHDLGRRLHVTTIDLTGPPPAILNQAAELAREVEALAGAADAQSALSV